MVLSNENSFRDHIRHVLLADDGLSVESEATIYIRSLEGGMICAGTLAHDGAIESEREFGTDIDTAIDWFVAERKRLSHGSTS
jgi:hypothetical protein